MVGICKYGDYEVEVYISEQALKKLKKDKYIREKKIKTKYMNIIENIAANIDYQAETIGDFRVSPRGNTDIRVVWDFEIDKSKKKIRIFIRDLIYHISNSTYSNNWDFDARNRKITKKDYSNIAPYTGL